MANDQLTNRQTEMKLSRKRWDELPQITDGYVVHARGFSIGTDIWFDAYNQYFEHTQLWNKLVRHEYDYEEYIGNFSEFADFDEPWIYWSITASESLLVQHPVYEEIGTAERQLVFDLVQALDIPDDARIVFTAEDGSVEGTTPVGL